MGLFLPNVAHAADFDVFLANVTREIINPLIGLLFAVAVVYFLYGMFEFIANQNNDEKKTTGKSHMLWGIIGIGIMVSVWTILSIIVSTLNLRGVEINNTNNQGGVNVNLR